MHYATRARRTQNLSSKGNNSVRSACFVVVVALLIVGVYWATPKVESKIEARTPSLTPITPISRAVRAPALLTSEAKYQGDAKFVESLQSGVARPVSLATEDFNLDGAPDLVTGFSSPENFITIQFGNIDAFVPSSPAVYAAIQRGEMPNSFDGKVHTLAVPGRADLISAGDFNGDSFPDILTATRGGGLYLLAGTPGGFEAPVAINLGGGVTAIGTGKFNLGGSVNDVAVAINGSQGPSIAVFDDQSGGILGNPVVYPVAAEATSVSLDSFDDDVFYDVAAVTDTDLQIIHGAGHNKIRSLASRVETIPLGYNARTLVAGNFVWDRKNNRELAVVAADGSVNVLQQQSLDTRRFTDAELAQMKLDRENGKYKSSDFDYLQYERGWQPGKVEWISGGRVSGVQASAGLIIASNVSSKDTDDLIVPDASSHMNVVYGAGERLTNDDTAAPKSPELSMQVDGGTPVAVLEMPRKVNGSRDVITVTEGAATEDVITILAATNITVDTTSDNPALSACTGAAGDCSLRGAIQTFAANAANQPATINVPAGTYNLTDAQGDIGMDGDGTSLVGAGAASTIIDQNVAAQRIMLVDVTAPFQDFDFSLSGLTLRNGDRTTNSGAAILCGGTNSTTNITNCVFSGNTIDIAPAALFGNGGAIAHALGASGDTGDLTLIATTFLNNIAENVGGGLSFDGGTGTPTATIRNCVFNNNQSRINDGGGMNLTAAGGSGSYDLTQNTFIENDILDGVADHDGGAVNKGNGLLTASFNRFFHNSVNSGGVGDSAFRAAGEGNVTVSNNWWGCNGDPSTPATGCDKVESAPAPGSTFTLNPRLQLTQTANPAEICINTATTLTASMLLNTTPANVGVTNLYVFTGVPPASPAGVPAATPLGILFDNPVLGTLSNQQTQIQSTATATATFTAGATGGNGSSRVTVDNAQVTTTIPIAQPIVTAAAGVTRQQGSPVSNSQIATATDTISAPALVVTVNGGASATVNGVTVSNIVWNSGTNAVTANVIASCVATNASFTLVVTDRLNCVSSSSTLNVAVTANTPPVLGNYSDTGVVAQGASFNVTPSAAPSDNGSVVTVTASASPGTFTGTFSGNATTGVISVSNANPSGTYTVTVTATDNCGATSTKTFQLIVNTPPDIVASGALTRQQGSPSSNSQIATVSDINQAANTLSVQVNNAASATVNGVTVSNIVISAGGNVTADIVASCTATNATFTLKATDTQAATDTDTLTVNVNPNTPPTLGNYPNTGPVVLGSNFTVTPDATPTDNGSVSTLTAAAPGFAGTFSGNTGTGVISVTNASPSGTYTVTVTATDNCGATSTKTFTLIVNTAPVITGAAPLARQQGSPVANSQIATVSDTNQASNTLVVTVNGGASATVNGVTVNNIVVDVSGNVTADIVASCAATNAAFTLTVTDSLGATDTDPLTVNVSANTPPTLGNYPNTGPINAGSGTTVTPDAAPTDNGSVSTLTASAPGFTGTFSGNTTTGVITVSNAAPAGSYTVTVTATDNCGATSTKTFTLDVQAVPADISVQDAKVAEPTSGSVNMVFTVTLSAPASGPVSVNFTTNTGGSVNLATAGSDYTTTTGTVNFVAGEQVKSILVPVQSDSDNAEVDETFLVDLSAPSGANIVDGQAVGTITVANPAGTFVVSEVRTYGPGGLGDDFVELYNNTNSPIVVNASDASGGYGVFKMGAGCGATPILIGIVPNGTTIPARGHYLMTGSQYSLANYGGTGAAAGDQTLSADIDTDANVAVFSTANVANISSVNRLDAIGFGTNVTGNCDLLREGTTLPSTGFTNLEGSYQRDQCGKLANSSNFAPCPAGFLPKDTNDNSLDFFWADVAATATTAGQHLGAPGPENLGSPILRNSVVALMLDATKAASAIPNRERILTPVANGANGTLIVRRRFRNDTGASVTRLRFRVIDITTTPTAGGIADMRAITSGDLVISGINDSQTCLASNGVATTPCSVTVKGTTLEQPPTQAIGGGNNSTLSAGTITVATPLAAGASINIQWTLGVQTTGSFRFFIIVEALP